MQRPVAITLARDSRVLVHIFHVFLAIAGL